MLDRFTSRLKWATYIALAIITVFGISLLPKMGFLALVLWAGLAYVAIATYYWGSDLQRATAIPIAVLALISLIGLKSGYINGLILLAILVNLAF